jgi:hypothetical protein
MDDGDRFLRVPIGLSRCYEMKGAASLARYGTAICVAVWVDLREAEACGLPVADVDIAMRLDFSEYLVDRVVTVFATLGLQRDRRALIPASLARPSSEAAHGQSLV